MSYRHCPVPGVGPLRLGMSKSQLANIVQDKRNGERSGAKKGRRNRHYEMQLIRNALTSGVLRANDTLESAANSDLRD